MCFFFLFIDWIEGVEMMGLMFYCFDMFFGFMKLVSKVVIYCKERDDNGWGK